MEVELIDIQSALLNIDYRESNSKAGYVYIIPKIRAYGENIYKISITHRLEPQDRVEELGDSSVPFRFNVHALIFTEDAPKLETALHNAFSVKKINMINTRKEFFRVTSEEIEHVVKANHDKSVEFMRIPEVKPFKQSLHLQRNQ